MASAPDNVDERLGKARTIWLATVDAAGAPWVRPVWFHWDGRRILVYSKPTAAKVRHIRASPRVCLHLDPNEWGEDVVIVSGEARFVEGQPRADAFEPYIAKYRGLLERFDITAEQLGDEYCVAIEIEPTRFQTY